MREGGGGGGDDVRDRGERRGRWTEEGWRQDDL